MKIQFINATLGGDFSALDIAITCLATYLNERTQHDATICDLTFHRREWQTHLEKAIERDKPDIIGISANTLYMQYIKTIAKEIKEKYGLPVILGGYHPSIHPEETINLPDVDYICIGDGEFVLTELLTRLDENKSVKGLNGIWAKQGTEIIRNERGSFIEDIDSLPMPNYDLWEDLELYFYFLGMLYVIGTRGCPHSCTYCDAVGIKDAVNGKYFRTRDPRKFAQEIATQYHKYKPRGLRSIQLFDQVFTIKTDWLREFSDEYQKLAPEDKFKFSTFARIDQLDEERADLLQKSGCVLLRVGVEAGNDYIRNEIYKKKITKEQIRKVFKMCKERDMDFTAFYMLGGPAESRKTVQETIDLACELDGARSAFFIYKPFTQESLDLLITHGGRVDQEKWAKADNITFDGVVYTNDITPAIIEFYQKKAYFLTFGRRLLRMLKKQKLKYFTHLVTYIVKGLWYRLDIAYLTTYYHIYAYENVFK